MIPNYPITVWEEQKIGQATWEFKTYTLKLCCCSVSFCIPCQERCDETCECVSKSVQANVVAYQNRLGKVDVYVENCSQPGYPEKYLIDKDMLVSAFKTKYAQPEAPKAPEKKESNRNSASEKQLIQPDSLLTMGKKQLLISPLVIR